VQKRMLGTLEVSAIGLGCMSMSQAYGKPDRAESVRALRRALEVGYTFLDTASIYGLGHNEKLVGEVLKDHRDRFVLASKCGIIVDERGRRGVDCRPEAVKQTCEESLARLETDVIDLYYLHRRDPKVPIEDSTGALADLVRAGKIRHIGLSEVSSTTLRKAHAVHPITAVQSEYSLWTRDPEQRVLEACAELGVGFVPFSPLGRAFLAGTIVEQTASPSGFWRPFWSRGGWCGDRLCTLSRCRLGRSSGRPARAARLAPAPAARRAPAGPPRRPRHALAD
jgi:aryl-alcohol dehydrogenase-like predicted oxidoreductase